MALHTFTERPDRPSAMSRWMAMPGKLRGTLAGKLLVLIVLVALPGIVLTLVAAQRQRAALVFQFEDLALLAARNHASAHRDTITAAHELLVMMAPLGLHTLPDDECSARLQSLFPSLTSYTTLGVIRPNGIMGCNALPVRGSIDNSDRPHVIRALATREFSVGEYLFGRASGKASLGTALPILGLDGAIETLLSAGIDVDRLSQRIDVTGIPRGSALTVLDARGTVLISTDQNEEPLGSASLVHQALVAAESAESGVLRTTHPRTGAVELAAYSAIGGGVHGWVAVRAPLEIVEAEANQLERQNLAILGALLLVDAVIALVLARGLFIGPMRALAATTARIAAGQLGTRTRLRYDQGEVGQLAVAIDQMADALERHDREQQEIIGKLAESEERFRILVNGTPDYGIFLLDPDGSVMSWNEGAERITGYTEAEILGSSRERFLPADSDPSRHADALRVAARDGRHEEEGWRVRRDGGRFYANVVLAGLRNEQGGLYGYSVVVRDITERRHLEQERDRYFDLSNDIIAVTDLAGRILRVNPAVKQVLGYEPAELIGKSPRELVHPDDWTETEHAIQSSGISGAPSNYRHRMRARNAEYRWLEWTGVVYPADGVMYGTARDVTDQKRWEESLQELNTLLEERVRVEVANNREKDHLLIQQAKLASTGEMIGNIAHQWRQPLHALSMVLANVEDAHGCGELSAPYLQEQVERGAELLQHMSTTIDDFRTFFRPDGEDAVFELSEVVRRATTIIEAAYLDHGITLQVVIHRDSRVSGRLNAFAQVLLNLLGNARDAFVERGTANRVVTIDVDQTEDAGVVVLRDTAGGIQEDVLERVFDPYFTTREGGTGIGLYMSRTIVESTMRGSIEVRNEGAGACFTVRCPRARTSVGAPETLELVKT